MLRYLAVLLILNYYIGSEASKSEFKERIVNGTGTSTLFHPHQVLLKNGAFFICGGSIINENIVITAAHCLENVLIENLQVRLGSSFREYGGILVNVSSYRLHEEYESRTLENDIALIKLAKPVEQSSKIRFIQLAENSPETGTPAVVTGWGISCKKICYPMGLQKIDVFIMDRNICRSKYFGYSSLIRDGMICAYSSKGGICDGDSGGPLVANNTLVGIASVTLGCGSNFYPGIYTNVAEYYDWIVDTMETLLNI